MRCAAENRLLSDSIEIIKFRACEEEEMKMIIGNRYVQNAITLKARPVEDANLSAHSAPGHFLKLLPQLKSRLLTSKELRHLLLNKELAQRLC